MSDRWVSDLEARIERLESERRKLLWCVCLGFVMLVGAVAFTGAKVVAAGKASSGTVEAREFLMRDESGQLLFYVGPEGNGAVLIMRDHSGQVTARLPMTAELKPVAR